MLFCMDEAKNTHGNYFNYDGCHYLGGVLNVNERFEKLFNNLEKMGFPLHEQSLIDWNEYNDNDDYYEPISVHKYRGNGGDVFLKVLEEMLKQMGVKVKAKLDILQDINTYSMTPEQAFETQRLMMICAGSIDDNWSSDLGFKIDYKTLKNAEYEYQQVLKAIQTFQATQETPDEWLQKFTENENIISHIPSVFREFDFLNDEKLYEFVSVFLKEMVYLVFDVLKDLEQQEFSIFTTVWLSS